MVRKGIILAGGKGTRLYPLTKSVSKQLLPIYNKPMIYYSLSTLMLAGIKEILLISTPKDLKLYKNLLGNGSNFGIKLKFAIQKKPEGIAQAFIIAKNFLNKSPCALILGDNFFYGQSFQKLIQKANSDLNHSTVFSYYVKNPSDYGVISINKQNKILSIEEKPKKPKSNYVVTGLYFYTNDVFKYAKRLKPSKRKELEITDINNIYAKNKKLNNISLGRGFTWLDAGNFETLYESSLFVKTIENRQGMKIGCPEEIAYKMNFYKKNQFEKILNKMHTGEYKDYLLKLLDKNEK